MSADQKKHRDEWVKKAVAAIDQFNIDRVLDGLRPFFDINNNSIAFSNAAFLVNGDFFSYTLGTKMKVDKRKINLPSVIEAFKKIDADRYESFKGFKEGGWVKNTGMI